MARPQALEVLTHDKLLAKKTFPQFVETFNYTVNRCDNLRGDADGDNDQGKITVDNSDPEHPVIRYIDLYEEKEWSETPKDADITDEEYQEMGLTPQKTIQTHTIQEEDEDEDVTEVKVVELYDFHNPSNVTTIDKDTIENYDFLMRGKDEHSLIYASVSGLQELLDGGGGGGCSCDLVPTLSSGTKIADWTKDGTTFTSIYSPSDVVSFTGTDSSQTVKADAFTFQSASDSNIVITCSGNVITVGAYYL